MTEFRGLHWNGQALEFIEQTLLPHEEKIVRTEDWRVIVDAIKRLAIRGAPAIGVAGACAVALAWRSTDSEDEFLRAADEIENARPTAVNLAWAVRRMLRIVKDGTPRDVAGRVLASEASAIADEDALMCERMAEHGVELIPQDASALTHCNTGALVTYGIGTALGILRRGYEIGRLAHVFACEARPLGQGARLTMWELDKLGMSGELLCDSAAGRLMQEGKVDFVILGADRVAGNGDTANKIGTFQLAILAKRFDIPFYVAAPSSTFDTSISSGDRIPVEQREGDEVRRYAGSLITLPQISTYNPAFDVTPAELITAFIREDGIHYPPYRFTDSTP